MWIRNNIQSYQGEGSRSSNVTDTEVLWIVVKSTPRDLAIAPGICWHRQTNISYMERENI